MRTLNKTLGTATMVMLAAFALVGASGCSSANAGDSGEQTAASSEEALSAGTYVVTPPGGTWMYTSNGQWLLLHPCDVVMYSPTPYDWGNGWVRVWFVGEPNYHPATLGQVQASALAHHASFGNWGCGTAG
jgi:hypothetical protein